MQLDRPLRLTVYLFRSGRMICRGWRRGTDKKFLLLDLLPNLIKSSWTVSGYGKKDGYEGEPFPSFFPRK